MLEVMVYFMRIHIIFDLKLFALHFKEAMKEKE
ncbi:Predicted protein [Streptococcus thermophilus LMD-9]|nr:Predicted protein [Streptococcus thermophilus LMD-9]